MSTKKQKKQKSEIEKNAIKMAFLLRKAAKHLIEADSHKAPNKSAA